MALGARKSKRRVQRQACGTGKIVADIVHGRAPRIDLDGLTLARFG